VPSIVGFGKAAEMAAARVKDTTGIEKLRDKLEKVLLEKIPDAKVNGDQRNRLPNTSNISFGYIEGESILLHLDDFGICASSGSACTSGSLEPSHVLRAMCVGSDFLSGSIRFSLSDKTTEADIDFVIEKLPPIIEKLRKISPFGRK